MSKEEKYAKIVRSLVDIATGRYTPLKFVPMPEKVSNSDKTAIERKNAAIAQENATRAEAMQSLIRELAELMLLYAPVDAVKAHTKFWAAAHGISQLTEAMADNGELATQWRNGLCETIIALRKDLDGVVLTQSDVLNTIFVAGS